MLSLCSKQQTSWDKMWAALEEIDDCDFLTPEERRQADLNRPRWLESAV